MDPLQVQARQMEAAMQALRHEAKTLSYAQVGMIAETWAILEFNVDLMNTFIFTTYGARSYEKRIPLALKTKLRFLRRAVNRIDDLAPYRGKPIAFVDKAIEIRPYRNIFVHGVGLRRDATGVEYHYLENQECNMGWGKMTFSSAQVTLFLKQSTEVSQGAFTLCQRFMADLFAKQGHADG